MKKTKFSKTKYFVKKHWKLILAIIYLISPIDIIPDVLLPLGYTEDILLLAGAVLDYLVRKKKDAVQFNKENEAVDGEVAD